MQSSEHSPGPHDPVGLASRRRFLRIGGLAVLGLTAAACSGSGEADTAGSEGSEGSGDTGGSDGAAAPAGSGSASATSAASTVAAARVAALTALTAADFDALGTCTLLPEKTAGPFPLDEQFDRRDITEDRPGHPMRLGLRVVDGSCAPVPGAQVEIWHADATGDYSAFTDNGGGTDEGSGTTFLRGTQTADDLGIVEFLTIVPGWYRGRAVHIHLRVHLDDRTVLTSQLFFDAAFVESVYAAEPYAANGLPDTSNEADGIAGDPAAEGTILHTSAGETTRGTGTLALLNLGVAVPAG